MWRIVVLFPKSYGNRAEVTRQHEVEKQHDTVWRSRVTCEILAGQIDQNHFIFTGRTSSNYKMDFGVEMTIQPEYVSLVCRDVGQTYLHKPRRLNCVRLAFNEVSQAHFLVVFADIYLQDLQVSSLTQSALSHCFCHSDLYQLFALPLAFWHMQTCLFSPPRFP